MEKTLHWETDNPSARQNFPDFYGTQTFTSNTGLVLNRRIQSWPSHPIALKPTNLRFVLKSGLVHSGLPIKILDAFAISRMCVLFMWLL